MQVFFSRIYLILISIWR